MAESLAQRAAKAILVQVVGRRVQGQIATNPKFTPPDIRTNPPNTPVQRRKFGVNPDTAPEVAVAGEALVAAALKALGEAQPILSVQDWLARESARVGGNGQLAAALLSIPYTVGQMGRGKNRQYDNLLRAIQRSARATKQGRKEEHKGFAKPEYIEMIADFPGGELGNPYAPVDRRGRAALEKSKVQLSAKGDWRISGRTYWGDWHGTDYEEAARFERLWSFPASFLEEMLEAIRNPGAGEDSPWHFVSERDLLELDWLYALSLIIELPPEK